MARNKYPEQTIQKILDVSFRLFVEKGYDRTTIQDITDALGMSKGAVYHHFKSKEAIFDQITYRYYDDIHWFEEIRQAPGLTGLEKARRILELEITEQYKLELDRMCLSIFTEPKLFMMAVQSTVNAAAPIFCEVIEEGVRDGSIQTDSPKELSEVFMLLCNVWIGMFSQNRADFLRKLAYLRQITDRMGFPVIDDAMTQTIDQYFMEIKESD